MQTCVIFNPSARGDKARHFRKQLDIIGREAELKMTMHAGHARELARQSVEQGITTVVAAGGDGTLNEVLNGIGDAAGGFERARLGLLPLGTVNVFARELGLPKSLEAAWEVIRHGAETTIDLPLAEFRSKDGKPESRYFAQLAGAGLDARAIELVKYQVKKLIGPLAYVAAGFHALTGPAAQIDFKGSAENCYAELVLIGNGSLYGGQFRLFPKADLRDGKLEICLFPKVNWMTLVKCSPGLLLQRTLPVSMTKILQRETFTLQSSSQTPVQLDGELVGYLPATFSVERQKLRVVCRPPV